jgi:hypothetical protein
MKMLARAVLAASLLAFVPAGLAHADDPQTKFVFEAVDAVGGEPSRVLIEGVLLGETTTRTLTVDFPNSSITSDADKAERCERLALIAQARPGRYLFEVEFADFSYPVCKLRRR